MNTHRSGSSCPHCHIPQGYVGRGDLPQTWESIQGHPRIKAGEWTRSSVLFCRACGRIWLVFFDPKDMYYSDILPLEPEFEAVLYSHPRLDAVWPLLFPDHRLKRYLIQGYFRYARYDSQAAVTRLAGMLSDPARSYPEAEQLVGLIINVLENRRFFDRFRKEGAPVARLADAKSLADILQRDKLFERDEPLLRKRMLGYLETLVERGLSQGPERADLLAVDPASREKLVRLAGPEARLNRMLAGMEGLALRIEAVNRDPTAPFPFGLLFDLEHACGVLSSFLSEKDLFLTPEGKRVFQRSISILDTAAEAEVPENAAPCARGAIQRLRAVLEEDQRRLEFRARQAAKAAEEARRETEARERIAAEPLGRKAKRLFFLAVAGAGIIYLDGIFFGLFTVPVASSSAALINIPILFVLIGIALSLTGPHNEGRAWVFVLAVATGTVLWGHHIAYEWDAKPWAERYWIKKKGAGSVQGIDADVLVTGFIRAMLEEPDAGGKWDMLRVRALIGADMPVSERFMSGRVRNPRVTGGEMWRKWMFDILLTFLAAGAVAWKGRDLWSGTQ